MKSNGFIKRFAFSVLLALGTVTGAFAQGSNLVLVAGTDFTPSPTNNDEAFVSWDVVSSDNVGFLGIIKPQVTMHLDVPTTTEFSKTSSDFVDGDYYCITNNPCKIDSFRLYDTQEKAWGLLLPSGKNFTGIAMTMDVKGLKPNSDYRVEIDYCFVGSYSKKWSCGYPGIQSNNGQINLGGVDPKLKFNVNPSQYDPAGATGDWGFSQTEKEMGACTTGKITPPTDANAQTGKVTASGDLQFNVIVTNQTAAMFITAIRIYAEVKPKITGVETVCVGGEKGLVSVASTYAGAKYQWYRDNTLVPGETGSSIAHTSDPENKGPHTYYYEMTIDDGNGGEKTLTSPEWKVEDIQCCTGPNGKPASRKLIWINDFGTFSSDGKTISVWNFDDLSNPKQVEKTEMVRPFVTTLPAIGGEAPEGAAGDDLTKDGGHNVVGWITDAQQGSQIGWAAQIGGTNEYWGPGRPNGEFFPDHTDQLINYSIAGKTLGGKGKYGAALFVNADKGDHSANGIRVYKEEIPDICEQTHLTVKCYVNNFSNGPNPVDIVIKAYDSNHFGDPEYGGQSEHHIRYSNEGSQWTEVSVDIPQLESGNLTFEILNYTPNGDGQGDDLILDDIMVFACSSPTVDLYFSLDNYAKDTTDCEGENVNLFVDETIMLTSYYGTDLVYLYQYTTSDADPSSDAFKKSWKNLTDPVTDKMTHEKIEDVVSEIRSQISDPTKYPTVKFRVIAGKKRKIENDLAAGIYFNPDDPCSNISISKPIELTIDCPTCTEPADDIKISVDDPTKVKPVGKKKVVELCYGESVTLSQAADITPDPNDWASSEFVGYAIKWFEDAEKYDDLTDAAIKLNDLVSDVTYSNTDETSTSTVEKRVVLYAIDAKYPKGTCKTADTIYIKFHPKPKAKYRQDDVEFCEGKGDGVVELTMVDGTESDYNITWWDGADGTGSSLGEGLDEDFFKGLTSDKSGIYSYQLTDKETKCKGDTFNYDVKVNPQPEKPDEETLVYAVNTESRWAVGTDQLLKNTVLTGIVWYENLTDPDANGSALGTVIDRTVTTEAPNSPIIKYIAYKDGNCYSERVPVTINIKKAPTPNLKDLKLCKGNSFDPMEGVVGSEAGYELVWFKPENVPNDTAGNALTTAPVEHVKTDVPGEYKMYAAYRQTSEPYAQGDIAEYTVTVYGVDKPLDKSKHEYCANDNGELLKADIVEDHTNFLYANEVVYLAPGASTAVSEQYATTATQTTKTYTYQAYQKYNIPGTDKSCEGDPIDIDVEVIAVKAPEVLISPVSYVKSEGKDTKTFDDILTKYPGAIKNEAGQTLKWSIEKNGPYAPGSSMGSQPFYDETIPDGTVENQVRYAMWEVVTSENTCSSEPSKIEITISSSPAPIVNPITICEEVFVNGPIPAAKEPVANASLNDNNTTLNITGYQLYWYTNKAEADAAMTTRSVANGSTTAPSLSSVAINITDKTQPKWEGEVYVVQFDGTTPSPASTLKITVNATPRLQPKAFDPVCGDKSSVDLTTGDYWNVENGVTVSTDIMHGTTPVTATANNLTEAGEYKVTATSVEGCTSDPLTLQLDIRHLSIKVEDKNTCPDGSVTQEVKINYTYNKNGAQAGTAQLQLTSGEATSTMSSQNFMVTKPAAGYDESEFSYTYTTGDFSATPKIHNVSVLVFDGVCDATKDFKVTIGDGPADGAYKWNETGNNSPFANTSISHSDATKDNITINACGGPVDLDFSKVTKTAGDFEWYKDNSYSSSSLFFSGDKPTFTESDYGVYYVRYTNQCYSYATVTIKDASVKILTATQPDVDQCEGTAYNMTINYVCPNPDNLTHQWYKDNSLYTSGDGLSFNKLIKSDEGTYKVEYTNDGCKAELDPVVNIKVREIVQFELDENTVEKYEGKNTQIVTAGENAKVDFKFKVPSSPAGLIPTLTQDPTVNDGSVTSDNMSYTINNVDEDHRNIKVSFASADYCESSVEFQVLRDAKLVLNAKVDDVAMCLHDTRRFTIDTISTGTFRRGAGVLKVMATPETGTAKEEKDFKKNALDTLWKNISPTVTTTYTVTFDYNGQHEEQDIKVTVYNFRVVTVADTVCAGEPVELKYEVYPSDSKVEWFNEDNVSLGENPGLVTPEFKGAATAPRSTYKYYARPYSDLVTCTSSSNKFPLVVTVYRPLDGEMKDTAICQGQSVRVDASSYGASSWTWTVDGEEIVGGRVYQDTPEKTTTYYVHMTRGNVCTKDAQATVVVNTNPVIESIDSLDYREVEVLMARDFGTSPFRYQIDEGEWTEDSHLTNLAYSIHTIKVVDKNGCELLDTFKINNPAIEIRHWFSPNQDGEFDKWTVEGIQKTYPEAEFTIFDRWGKKLAEFKGADDGWDGTYNGVDMPSTDYWYELIVREIDKIYTGHFTLIRR